MRKIIVALILIAGPILGAGAYVKRPTATISIMNKAAGKVQTFAVPVGQNTEFEKLSFVVRTCQQTDPFQAEEHFMFVEISKANEGKIFSGWMSKNSPGDNPLQNADYDLWLVKCE